MEIYGFVQAEAFVDFRRNDPNWYDTNRPSKLPAFANEFGQDGHFYLSPRQTRFGVNDILPTAAGDVHSNFEFDMLGTGSSAGQTTIRLRHAWGQWKQLGAGQTFSQFMDADIYPNRLDSWGPNGMPTSRNPQVFWEPYREGNSNMRVALENPGVASDGGIFADRIELQHVTPRFTIPDITGHYRCAESWGYIQISGVVLRVAYDDLAPQNGRNLSGHVWGGGANVSSNIYAGPDDVFRLLVLYGRDIENYLNDAPVDVGVKLNPGDPTRPIIGDPLPVVSMVAYLDHTWNETWATTVGYSMVNVSNSNGEPPSAFRLGQYATANVRYLPVQNVAIGAEFQWAQRRNFSDHWTANDFRLDFSFKYTFSYKLGGKP
jgi:hypothetical protein